jgi:DNA-directed RNA polymerase specialized sigma24 family protein
MRRLFDSQDILSTVLRRLDVYITGHVVTAESEREVRALLLKICKNAIIDKVRIVQRLKRTEGADSPFALMMLNSIGATNSHRGEVNLEDLARFFDALPSTEDRSILWLWLAGQDHSTIATTLNMSHSAVRKRWQRIRNRLKTVIMEKATDDNVIRKCS